MSKADEKKLTGNETDEELIERLNKVVDDHHKKIGFTENIQQAADFAKAYLIYKKKARTLREAMDMLQSESLEIPESYAQHAKFLEKKAEDMRPNIPANVELAFEDMTHERLLTFIEKIPVSDDDDTRKEEEYLVLVKHLTNSQKEKIYHTLREKEIKGFAKERVREFEWFTIKYSYDFARKYMMDDLPEDTEIFLDFLKKHTKGFTKNVIETLEFLDAMRDGHYTDEMIEKRASNTLGRFGIKGKTPEERVALKKELAEMMQDYFPDSPKNRGEWEEQEEELEEVN